MTIKKTTVAYLLLWVCLLLPVIGYAQATGSSSQHNGLFFLQYVLPLLNVVILLTVNRKVRIKLFILMAIIGMNVAGLYMLRNGYITDDKTHGRATGIFIFFTIVELLLLFRWSRKLPPTDTQKEDAQNP